MEGRRPRAQDAPRHRDAHLRRRGVCVHAAEDLARRSIDLPTFVVAYLRRHREEQKVRSLGNSDVVLDNGVGEPLAPWTASADFRRIVKELELPRTRFHDLRHAHATQLPAAGVHPKAVSERLGHSNVAFTMDTYSAHIPSMGRAAADAADQLSG